MLPANNLSVLSGAKLETLMYAGETCSNYIAGSWSVDETCDNVQAAPDGAATAVRFRRGLMLGDGAKAAKGGQSAGIILDNCSSRSSCPLQHPCQPI